jgi:FixJ family two-component response regulator
MASTSEFRSVGDQEPISIEAPPFPNSGRPVAKLLIVDDESAQLRAVCKTLALEGYHATGYTSPTEALGALRNQTFDLVLSDLVMPDMDGIHFLKAALAIDPAMGGIVMTGHGTIDAAVKAMQAGALDVLVKPFQLRAALPVLARALAVRSLRMENIQLHEAIGIYKLSMSVAFVLDSDVVLEDIAEAALGQSLVRGVSILLPTEAGDELQVAADRGVDVPYEKGARIPFTPEISAWVERRREFLPHPGEVDAAGGILDAQPGQVMRGLPVPMLSGGKFVGFLSVSLDDPRRPIAPGQCKALHILASAAASAIERSSLVERLRGAEKRYRRLTENAPDIVYRYELNPRRCSYVNPAVESITGYNPEQFYSDPDLGLKIAHPEDRGLVDDVLQGRWVGPDAATPRRCGADTGTDTLSGLNSTRCPCWIRMGSWWPSKELRVILPRARWRMNASADRFRRRMSC